MAHIVILGNSVAGHSAAVNIRARDTQSGLTVVSAEPYLFYDRRKLGDFLQGTVKEQELFPCSDDFYRTQNITVKTGCVVTAINPLKRSLSLKDKGSLTYDCLVVATGVRHVALTIPGAKKPGVVTLYTLDDVKKFKDGFVSQPVCIIGWNKGVQVMAQAIAARYGVEVKVIAPSGVDAAALPAAVEVIHTPVAEIIGEGCVQAVKLSNGKVLGVGTVISMDEEPSVDFLKNTLVRVSARGVEVDDVMRTSVERIFSCGCVAHPAGQERTKTWIECTEEGCCLADSLAKEMEHVCRTYS
jgi:NAD(P)H-nitrite reductase large subunit